MYGVNHHIANEFPEFSGKIEQLKLNDQAFSRLLNKYEETNQKIHRYEQLRLPVANTYRELKKWRLKLKDQLYAMLRRKTAPNRLTT